MLGADQADAQCVCNKLFDWSYLQLQSVTSAAPFRTRFWSTPFRSGQLKLLKPNEEEKHRLHCLSFVFLAAWLIRRRRGAARTAPNSTNCIGFGDGQALCLKGITLLNCNTAYVIGEHSGCLGCQASPQILGALHDGRASCSWRGGAGPY